jgi:hypothetical protein
MVTDIKLNDRFVEIDGNALKAQTWDIMLDSPDRRIQPTPEYRRALVHNIGDKLTINYAKDYPGGVEIEGRTKIEDLEVTGSAKVQNLEVAGTIKGHTKIEDLEVTSGDVKIGGVTIKGPKKGPFNVASVLQPHTSLTLTSETILVETKTLAAAPLGQTPAVSTSTLDLVQVILTLRAEVDKLKQQVQYLQSPRR